MGFVLTETFKEGIHNSCVLSSPKACGDFRAVSAGLHGGSWPVVAAVSSRGHNPTRENTFIPCDLTLFGKKEGAGRNKLGVQHNVVISVMHVDHRLACRQCSDPSTVHIATHLPPRLKVLLGCRAIACEEHKLN